MARVHSTSPRLTSTQHTPSPSQIQSCPHYIYHPPLSHHPTIIVSETRGCCFRLFSKHNMKKVAHPNCVPPATLWHCADQLVIEFTWITSLQLCRVPDCFKVANITAIPTKDKVTWLKVYRPIALTPFIMKTFEHPIFGQLKSITDSLVTSQGKLLGQGYSRPVTSPPPELPVHPLIPM